MQRQGAADSNSRGIAASIPAQEQSITPQILQTDVLSHIRFPCSEKRFRALASAVSRSASPKDAATAKPGSTYLSYQEWRNRQLQWFFVLEVSRYWRVLLWL